MALSQDSIKGMTVKETLNYAAREYCKCHDNEPYDKSFKTCITNKFPVELTYELAEKIHNETNWDIKK